LRDVNTICRRSWYIAAHVGKIYDFKNRTDFLKTKSYKCTIKVDSLIYFDLCPMKNSA
jgi:hypothetical protein